MTHQSILLDKERTSVTTVPNDVATPHAIVTDAVRFTLDRLPAVLDASGNSRSRFRAVGSVANVLYQSGRVIPHDVQRQGVEDTVASGRQLTSFIEHPDIWLYGIHGNAADIAARIVEGPAMNDSGQTEIVFELCATPMGERVQQLYDSKIELGVSQRALGVEEWREIPDPNGGEPTVISVVTKIKGIYGYDIVHLDAANAGNSTKIAQVSDSVLAAARPTTKQDSHMKPPTPTTSQGGQPANQGQTPVNDSADSAKALAETLKTVTDTVDAGLKAVRDEIQKLGPTVSKPVTDNVNALSEAFTKLVSDTAMPADEKLKTLTALGDSIKVSLAAMTGAQPPKPAEPAHLAAINAAKSLNDSLGAMVAANASERKKSQNLETLDKLLAQLGGPDFGDTDKKVIRDSVHNRVATAENEDAVKMALEDALQLVNAGRAKERLVKIGYKAPTGGDPTVSDSARIVISGRGHLEACALLHDKIKASGQFQTSYDLMANKYDGKDAAGTVADKLCRLWDKRFGHKLNAELEKLRAMGGGKLTDAIVHADFETPYTIARTVLFETWASFIVPQVVSVGTMENDRDTVPITVYRRETGNLKMRKPSVAARQALRVGEFGKIPRGKTTTDWVNIDASARKLGALISDEFIARSKRRPDINGVAIALQNLRIDFQHCIQQDVFAAMLTAACASDDEAFTNTTTADGTLTTVQVTTTGNQAANPIPISLATAVTITPGSLTVEVNAVPVPQYGITTTPGGPGANMFYVPDYPRGRITFVDANGAPLAPTNTHPIEVSGSKVAGLNNNRFNLTTPSGLKHVEHMNGLLFAIQDLQAALVENEGYLADEIVTSRTIGTVMTQAEAYQPATRMGAFNAGGQVREGNFGSINGMGIFGSDVFPSNLIFVGMQEATLFRVFEPFVLKGPHPSRNADGELNGGEEYYSYQEDSLSVPVDAKMRIVTVDKW